MSLGDGRCNDALFVSRFFREQRYTLFLLLQKKYMQRIIKKKTVVRGDNLTTVLVIQTVSIVTIVWKGRYISAVTIVLLCCNGFFATR